MLLYVIRHGEAEELGPGNGFRDEDRRISDTGRKHLNQAARGLKKLGLGVDIILTSPLIRAAETASLLADALAVPPPNIRTTPNLEPGAFLKALFQEVEQLPLIKSLALVGHQPGLGNLISTILQGNNRLEIELKKGSVCCLDVPRLSLDSSGTLVWLLTSSQLRLLGKN